MDLHQPAARYGPGVGIVAVMLALGVEMWVLLSEGLNAFDALHPLPVRVALAVAGVAFLVNAAFVVREPATARQHGISPISGEETSDTTALAGGALVGFGGLVMLAVAAVAL